MKNILKTISLLFIVIMFSCKENKTNAVENSKSKNDTINKVAKSSNIENEKITINDDEYPKFGSQISTFVNNKYNLFSKSKGDLNQDGLQDIALILQLKKDSLAAKPLLILLQQKDKSYLLDKISYTVIPKQYTEEGYKIYESQDLEIAKGVLSIENIGTGGSSGNINYNFKYFEKDFLLTYIETYNVGAGAWQSLYYDVLDGKLTEEITNTMKEEMPVEQKTVKVKKQKIHFEKALPVEIIEKVYQKEYENFNGL